MSPCAVLAAVVVRCGADLKLVHRNGRQRREQRTGSRATEVILVGRIGAVDGDEDGDLGLIGREEADEGGEVLLRPVVALIVGSPPPDWSRRSVQPSLASTVPCWPLRGGKCCGSDFGFSSAVPVLPATDIPGTLAYFAVP